MDIMERHYHYHTKIPVHRNAQNVTLSREQIWTICVNEMYDFCRLNQLPQVFRYMWMHWYSPCKWQWWSLSSCDEIPMARTTMLVESLWKVLKRDYLYKFVRPRIDFLIFVIVKRFHRHLEQRFHLLNANRQAPSWKKGFIDSWNLLSQKLSQGSYQTNIKKWICSCPSFGQHKYFLCKHLVHAATPIRVSHRRKNSSRNTIRSTADSPIHSSCVCQC
ncbi:hypothetical protein BKA69DRAFT_1034050 [Paraphysoderma sedebokerense]|nr:hypothetical protein BKA69DRAFT_1034050 [Paraphysoderma sedebokerense]